VFSDGGYRKSFNFGAGDGCQVYVVRDGEFSKDHCEVSLYGCFADVYAARDLLMVTPSVTKRTISLLLLSGARGREVGGAPFFPFAANALVSCQACLFSILSFLPARITRRSLSSRLLLFLCQPLLLSSEHRATS
jgi:hypothetical protein